MYCLLAVVAVLAAAAAVDVTAAATVAVAAAVASSDSHVNRVSEELQEQLFISSFRKRGAFFRGNKSQKLGYTNWH